MELRRVETAILLGIATCTLAGCSGHPGTGGQGTPTIDVCVEPARIADETRDFAYSGTLEESETIPLTFAVVGTVARVHVSEGDVIHKGQPLASLNDESFRSLYEMALATRKQAEDAFARLEPMYRNGNLPEVKFIEIQTDVQKARSSALIARKNLDDCTLLSPVDGIVGKRSIEPGMTTIPNVTSLTIVKFHKVYARVSVSENEISLIRKGQKATVAIAALNNRTFDGTVDEIGVLADPLAHTYRIRIGIPNKDLAIKPGMICTVRIPHEATARGVTVPGAAVLVDEAGRHFVYIIDSTGSTAARRFVKPQALVNDGIALTDGLRSGELVVISGQHKLVDSAAVRVVNR